MRKYFFCRDFDTSFKNLVSNYLGVNPESDMKNHQDWLTIKNEFISPQGNYDVSLLLNLIENKNCTIFQIKNEHNFSIFLSCFRGNPDFVGCLLQKQFSKFGHYTSIHHDVDTGKIYFMDGAGGGIVKLIDNFNDLKKVLHEKKVWGIFNKILLQILHTKVLHNTALISITILNLILPW